MKRENIIFRYAVKFNIESNDLGGFKEIINKDAFNDIDLSDINLLYNEKVILNNIKCYIDDIGFKFEIDLNNKTISKLYENKNIYIGFVFSVNKDDFKKQDDIYLRIISKYKKIHSIDLFYCESDNELYWMNQFTDLKELRKEKLKKLENYED